MNRQGAEARGGGKGQRQGQRQGAEPSGTRIAKINVLVANTMTNVKTHYAVQTEFGYSH
jgi:hypothetical protein